MAPPRDNKLEHLHPRFRQKMQTLLAQLAAEDLPFQLFEGFRTPQLQQYYYDQGRTRPGNIVTKARPWHSNHQYGLAGDFVLFEDGSWSWDDSGERQPWWERLHALAREVGLTPLSFEKPHLELLDLDTDDLLVGNYPPGGDQDWAENLAAAIYSWTGSPAAPPLPQNIPARPPLAPTPDIEPPPSMAGHGTFIYDATATIGRYGSPELAAQAVKALDMQHVWVRIHGAQQMHALEPTRSLVRAFKGAGIGVAGWGWCQGEDVSAEARLAQNALNRFELEDYVADLEPGVQGAHWTEDEINSFFSHLREGLAAKSKVALSTHAFSSGMSRN
jgi:hypothetical protein